MRHTNQQVYQVNTHLEAPVTSVVPSLEVTAEHADLTASLLHLADSTAGAGSAHEIHLYRPLESTSESPPDLDVVVHTTFAASIPLSQVHLQAEQIKRAFRQAYPTLGTITIHTEPPEEAPTQARGS